MDFTAIGKRMTSDELNSILAELKISQADLTRIITFLSEEEMSPSTVWRWCSGNRKVPPTVVCIIRLLQGRNRKSINRLKAKAKDPNAKASQTIVYEDFW